MRVAVDLEEIRPMVVVVILLGNVLATTQEWEEAMFDFLTADREQMLRQMIAEYERDLERERARFDELRVEEAKLRFSMEILEEHGEHEEAERTRPDWRAAQHRVREQQKLIQRQERILAIYREKLEKIQRGAA